MRTPVWLHGLVRILLPLPGAAAAAATYVWGAVTLFPEGEFAGRGWLIAAAAVGGLAVLVAGWLAPRVFLKLLPVRCSACGGRAVLAPVKGSSRGYLCGACGARFESSWRPDRLLPGLVTLGITTLFAVLLLGAAAPVLSKVGSMALLFPFLVMGIVLIGDRPLQDLIRRSMPWTMRVPWTPLLGGGIAVGLGVLFVFAGLLGDESTMPAGRGALVAAGSVFALAGISIFLGQIHGLLKGRARRAVFVAGTAVAFLLLVSFAGVPIAIAIHDAGADTLSVGPFLSAGLVLAVLGAAGVVAFRQWRRRKDA